MLIHLVHMFSLQVQLDHCNDREFRMDWNWREDYCNKSVVMNLVTWWKLCYCEPTFAMTGALAWQVKKKWIKKYFVVSEEDCTGIARDLPQVWWCVCDLLLLVMLSFIFIDIPRITKKQIITLIVKDLLLSQDFLHCLNKVLSFLSLYIQSLIKTSYMRNLRNYDCFS